MSPPVAIRIALLALFGVACVAWAVIERRKRQELARQLDSHHHRAQTVRDLLRAADIRLWETEFAQGRTHVDLLGTSDQKEDAEAAPEYSWYSLIHPDDRQALTEARNRQLAEGVPFYVEYRRRNEAGKWRWNAARGLVRHDAEKNPTHFSGMSYDIHDRKIMEQILHEREARMERALQNSRDGAYELNFRTGELWWAPNIMQKLGYGPDEQIRKPPELYALMHSEDRERVYQSGVDHIEGKTPFCDTEFRLRSKAGEWHWIRGRAKIERDAEDRPLRLTGMASDFTEVKKYQEALIQATEAAAAANRAKSEFLANMSHEIRTPMNGVLGMSELQLDTELTDMQRDYVYTVRDSSIALLAVINDILDFSKIEAGKLELERVGFDLRDTIEQATKVVRVQALAKGLEIITQIDDALPSHVLGDSNRLRQILVNLLSNAVKFTARGSIKIKASVESSGAGQLVLRCVVSDTGVGISRDRLETLFAPFTQGDASTTRKYGGTGLGLSIVKRLATLMGGEVGAESAENVGSQFWFTARLDVPEAPSPERLLEETKSVEPVRRPLASSVQNQKILVAEDNTVNQKVASHLLRKLGYEVTLACNGKEAVELWEQQKFALILMDCQMPELDGYEAAREIRRREDGSARTPILALTAHAMSGAADECLAAGMDDYLSKPIDRTQLAAKLEAWLGNMSACLPPEAIDRNAVNE